MLVDADSFHPMRGHVKDRAQVRFADGRIFTIKNVGTGWGLFDADTQIGETLDGAYELTRQIVKLNDEFSPAK